MVYFSNERKCIVDFWILLYYKRSFMKEAKGLRLVPIPTSEYEEYRLSLMFDCYKWDPQFLDNNTVARYALVITEDEHKHIKTLTEGLDKETREAEQFLNINQGLVAPLRLTRQLRGDIGRMSDYNPDKHIRLTRYDFHPVSDVEGGWAISEVNSDVPGGFAEASLMPLAAMECIDRACTSHIMEKASYHIVSFGDVMVEAVKRKVKAGGRIMLVHCTCYSDDRQVMQFLGDRLKAEGYQVIYGAVEHVNFVDKKAYCVLDGNEGELDAIFRFTPLEWFKDIKPKRWQGYFDTETVSCNHPVAIYAQTKRFPFIWEVLRANGISMTTWRSLLPETIDVKSVAGRQGYIYKPAYGRVGDGISIREALDIKEYEKIIRDVERHPSRYVAQKKFSSIPLMGENDEKYHVCLGSYAIDGVHGGYYARISSTPRIDSNAADIPVLIEGGLYDTKGSI